MGNIDDKLGNSNSKRKAYLLNCGNTSFDQKNYEEANEYFKKVLKIDPNDLDGWNSLGDTYRHQKNYQEATRCFKMMLEIDPNNVFTWFSLGNTYSDQDNYPEAISCFKKALEIDPNDGFAWCFLGDTHREQKYYQESIYCYKKALEIDPNDSDGWNGLGKLYFDKGDYPEAIGHFKKALEIDPNDFNGWIGLGAVHHYQKDYPEAIRHFKKALEIDPNDLDGWNGLGKMYFDKGDYPEAIRHFKKALEIDPNYAEANKKISNINKILDMKIQKSEKEVDLPKIANNNNKKNAFIEIKIIREFEFIHGQIRFKIGFINKSDTVITDLETHFKIPEALKWIGHEPNFKRKGDSVTIPKLSPEEKKVISLYLEPINCMEGDIRATISYSDARNQLHTTIMKDKTINISCPIFFTSEDANLARVKSLFRSLTNKDRKMLPLPSCNLTEIFSLIQSTIGSHDIKLISKEFSLEEKIGELMYYGVTKVKQNSMVIKVLLDGKQQVIELEVAGDNEDSITSLLAEIQNQLRTSFKESGLIKNKNFFMEIKTGVILRICPYCGSEIKLEEQKKYKNGEDICCRWCKNYILNY